MASDPLKIEVVLEWRLCEIRWSGPDNPYFEISAHEPVEDSSADAAGDTLKEAAESLAEKINSPQSANQILEAAKKVLGQ